MSSGSTFDVARVRQNWNRSAGRPEHEISGRLAGVATPGDPVREAEAVLAEIEREIVREFPEDTATLAPFLVGLRARISRLAASESTTDEADAGDSKTVREAAVREVYALSDVCEALMRAER